MQISPSEPLRDIVLQQFAVKDSSPERNQALVVCVLKERLRETWPEILFEFAENELTLSTTTLTLCESHL